MRYIPRAINAAALVLLLVLTFGFLTFVARMGGRGGGVPASFLVMLTAVPFFAHLGATFLAWRSGRNFLSPAAALWGLALATVSGFAWTVVLAGAIEVSWPQRQSYPWWAVAVLAASAVLLPLASLLNFLAIGRDLSSRATGMRPAG